VFNQITLFETALTNTTLGEALKVLHSKSSYQIYQINLVETALTNKTLGEAFYVFISNEAFYVFNQITLVETALTNTTLGEAFYVLISNEVFFVFISNINQSAETALTNTTLEEALCVFISNISNQSAVIALTNTTLEEAICVFISNIKSISRDSVNQHDTRRSTLSLHIKSISRDSVNQHDTRRSTLSLHIKYEIPRQRLKQRCPRRCILSYQNQRFTLIRHLFPISNQSAKTGSCLKQHCSREVKSLHQSVNHFQYQINQPRQSFKTKLFPRSQKLSSICRSLPISNQSAKTGSCLKQHCSREVKSYHQSVNNFQYQINQPRQSFETTLSLRSQKFKPTRQSLPISNQSAETVV